MKLQKKQEELLRTGAVDVALKWVVDGREFASDADAIIAAYNEAGANLLSLTSGVQRLGARPKMGDVAVLENGNKFLFIDWRRAKKVNGATKLTRCRELFGSACLAVGIPHNSEVGYPQLVIVGCRDISHFLRVVVKGG